MINRIAILAVVLGMLVTQAAASFDGTAELPRHVPLAAPAYTPANDGVVAVAAGANLQTALNNAKCGQKLQLAAGAQFVGNFVLPKKDCDTAHWIWIETSSPDGVNGMPGIGSRITPCRAGVVSLPGRPKYPCANPQHLMATIVGTIQWADGAGRYRLGPGLEITRQAKAGINYGLVVPANGGSCHDIVIDRNWIHGDATNDTSRGIFLSGCTTVAVVNNYMTDFHCAATIGQCTDAQAIAGGTGPLPQGDWLIQNNFLEAAAENILFGGVLKNSVTPADVTIRKNYLFKPLTWLAGQPGFVGAPNTDPTKCAKTPGFCPFVVKNLFELKNAQRLLFEKNGLENSWPGFSQYGESILLSGLNPPALAGSTVNSTISLANITVRLNSVLRTTSLMNIVNMAGQGEGGIPNLPVSHISVHDNQFDDIGDPILSSSTTDLNAIYSMFSVSSCGNCVPLKGILIDHNTALSHNPHMGFVLGATGIRQLDLTFTNNIATIPPGLPLVGGGGTAGDCIYSAGATPFARLANCLVDITKFSGNILIGATGTWPDGNALVPTVGDVGFNIAQIYGLLPTSKYVEIGTDGKNPGADVFALTQAIANVQ